MHTHLPRRQAVFCAALVLATVFTAVQFGQHSRRLQGSLDSESVVIELTVAGAFPVHLRAKPEKRIPSSGNDGTQLAVEFRTPGSTTALFSQTVTTSSGGTYSGLSVTGINAGTYDIAAKGFSHLRLTKTNVAIVSGSTIDFTTNGTDPLLTGDANDDNTVNGLDLTLVTGDLLGATVKYDFNRDGLVNGIDLTDLVTNLNESGDA